jgi:hypothetical protein
MAGKCGPALELARVKESLKVAGQFHAVRAFLGGRFRLRFPGERNTPGEHLDDGCSM